MAQMPALIPKEVEIQRLKKIWLIVIAMGSTAASVEVDNFVDGFAAPDVNTGQRLHSRPLVALQPLRGTATGLGCGSHL